MSSVLAYIPLLAQAGATTSTTLDQTLSMPVKLAIAAAVIGGSFALGSLLARMLRMPDFAFRIGLVLCTVVAGIVVCVLGWPPKLGIDLSGGVVLVYEVDPQSTRAGNREELLQQLNSRLAGIEGAGAAARFTEAGQLEVTIRNPDSGDKVRQAIEQSRSAQAGFRPAGDRQQQGRLVLLYDVDREHFGPDMDKLVNAVSQRINPGGVKEVTVRQYGSAQLEVIIPEVEEREVEVIKRQISTAGALEFRIVANKRDHADIIALALESPGRDVYQDGKLVGRWVKVGKDVGIDKSDTTRKADDGTTEILMVMDEFNVEGGYLSSASTSFDERGAPAVHFSLNSEGAGLFRGLTNSNLPDEATGFSRRLGIVLDNELKSAPNIRSTISDNGQITGSFTQDEVDFLVGILNAGSLPAALQKEPISEQKISAQLGADTIRSGANAMLISTGLVILFMFVYYRFAGAVADFAVILNMVLTLALMILVKAAFTLPGLAGLVLTVGMAVDANVLIYERMREESSRGTSLRMTIRNGYSRAMATIIDSHVTTIITGVVLYMIGSDQIKGFAVTLILGLLVSLYTAVYVSRLIFDIFERKHWLNHLQFLHVIGETNLDFVRWLKPAMAFSALLIVAGLVAAAQRGQELFDIDFTGGSSVQLDFAPGKARDIADVRAALEQAKLPDVAVSAVGTENRFYKIDTSERDINKVQRTLEKLFEGDLQTYSMKYAALRRNETNTAPASPSSGGQQKTNSPAPPDRAAAPPSDNAAPRENAPQPKGASIVIPFGTQLASVGSNERILSALLMAQPAEKAAAQSGKAGSDPPTRTSPAPQVQKKAPASDTRTDSASTSGSGASRAAAGADSVGSVVQLIFDPPISHGALSERIEQHLKTAGYRNVDFRLKNPLYKPDSSKAFANWELQISLAPDQTKAILDQIDQELARTPVFPSSSAIGGRVAGRTKEMAIYALLASLVMIVVYVWVRFQNVVFGIAAVIALLHDVLVAIAFLGLSYYLAPYLGFLQVDPFKISLAVVAALLTIVGFSINDTIVIFDRIRELRGKSTLITKDMVNASVNQTLSRTILTSGTVLIATLILYFAGGQGIHAFAFTMLMGVISGTYSTVYIAAPIVLWFRKPGSTPAVREREPAAALR